MKKTIMLVDDEPELLEVLTSMLEDDYVIVTAGDYFEAMTFLKEKEINGVITDLHIPNGSGLDLIKHIKAHMPMIPSCLITGETFSNIAKEAYSSGAASCLSKPFNAKKLYEVVDNLVKTNSSQMEEYKSLA